MTALEAIELADGKHPTPDCFQPAKRAQLLKVMIIKEAVIFVLIRLFSFANSICVVKSLQLKVKQDARLMLIVHLYSNSPGCCYQRYC